LDEAPLMRPISSEKACRRGLKIDRQFQQKIKQAGKELNIDSAEKPRFLQVMIGRS
jgi:hypothetical protein